MSKVRLYIASILVVGCVWSHPIQAQQKPTQAPKTGWDYAGFPLVNFTTDRGVGYGAFVSAFYHGQTPEPDIPYRASIGGQFYQTTGGYAFHKLLLDFPKLFGSNLRLDLVSGYEAWDSAWYFGLGNRTPRLPESDTPDTFYTFDTKSLWAVPTLRIPLSTHWSLFTGYTLRLADVHIYRDSLLAQDMPEGNDGGILSQLAVGIMVDTRDQEPSPTKGYWSEVSARFGHPFMGSDFALWGANTTHRHWFTLTNNRRLVLAIRLGLDIQGGDVPFFHQQIMGGSQWVELGGNSMLRGLPFGRYRGNITAYKTTELRWDFWRFAIGKAQFKTLTVPFIEVGRVWAWEEDDDVFHLHGTAGAGLRLIYNDVFVMRFDVALGLEEYQDADDAQEIDMVKPVLGIYAIVNHPF